MDLINLIKQFEDKLNNLGNKDSFPFIGVYLLITFTIFLITISVVVIKSTSLPQDINVNKEIPQKYIILECREKK